MARKLGASRRSRASGHGVLGGEESRNRLKLKVRFYLVGESTVIDVPHILAEPADGYVKAIVTITWIKYVSVASTNEHRRFTQMLLNQLCVRRF